MEEEVEELDEGGDGAELTRAACGDGREGDDGEAAAGGGDGDREASNERLTCRKPLHSRPTGRRSQQGQMSEE